MYAVYHGPERLKAIATRINENAATLAAGLEQLGYTLSCNEYFDTLCVELGHQPASDIIGAARTKAINLRTIESGTSRVIVALDETVTTADITDLLEVFAAGVKKPAPTVDSLGGKV